MLTTPTIAAGSLAALRHFINHTIILHPILADFTAALIPVSVGSDILSRLTKSTPLRNTAWWTLLYATLITPFTVIAGWVFWDKGDVGDPWMTVHKWLGTSLGVLLFGLFAWRWKIHRDKKPATAAYLLLGIIFVIALIIQGSIGGAKVFSG